jgi:hypothetical protein
MRHRWAGLVLPVSERDQFRSDASTNRAEFSARFFAYSCRTFIERTSPRDRSGIQRKKCRRLVMG